MGWMARWHWHRNWINLYFWTRVWIRWNHEKATLEWSVNTPVDTIDYLFDSDMNSRIKSSTWAAQASDFFKNSLTSCESQLIILKSTFINSEFSIRWYLKRKSGEIPKITIEFKKLVRIKSAQFRTAFTATENKESYK